jgi:hypothetical protein
LREICIPRAPLRVFRSLNSASFEIQPKSRLQASF